MLSFNKKPLRLGHDPINPRLFSPFPKNPVIARAFKEIGLADELGSGVRKPFKYCKTYCGHDPELIENDIFRLILSLSEASEKVTGKTLGKTLGKTPKRILIELKANPKLTVAELAAKLNRSENAVNRAI